MNYDMYKKPITARGTKVTAAFERNWSRVPSRRSSICRLSFSVTVDNILGQLITDQFVEDVPCLEKYQTARSRSKTLYQALIAGSKFYAVISEDLGRRST